MSALLTQGTCYVRKPQMPTPWLHVTLLAAIWLAVLGGLGIELWVGMINTLLCLSTHTLPGPVWLSTLGRFSAVLALCIGVVVLSVGAISLAIESVEQVARGPRHV